MIRNISFKLPQIQRTLIRNVYQSRYNSEIRFPGSKLGEFPEKIDENDKFNGEIPVEQLNIKYSKSSGPGGQHVNKTMSKAQVRFNVQSATWLSNPVKEKLIENHKRRMTKDGELIVQCDQSRYQMKNVQTCLDNIKQMIELAQKDPDDTKQKALEALFDEEKMQIAAEKRLKKKRSKSVTKQMRNNFDF